MELPEGGAYSQLITPISSDCRYGATAGCSAAWRYGCSYGIPAGT